MNTRWLLVSACMALTACASVPSDRGSAHSVVLLQSRSNVAAAVRLDAKPADIGELLNQPLDADAAVRIALNCNPRMQTLYSQLGLAQADVYDASRLSNPSLGFMRLTADSGARTTWTLTQSFSELLFINYRTRMGRSEVLQAQQRVAQSVLTLEAQVRTAYYQYVSATLVAQLHEQSSVAAQASADYAQSLFKAGNISELQLSREQAAASQARIELQSELTAAQQRQGALLTLMGLPFNTSPEFVQRLDVPVEQKLDATSLQAWAEQQRMDLANWHEQISLYNSMQTHARRWFWLADTQVQLERERETDGTRLSGAGGSVGLPLFNQGAGSRLRATSQLEMAQAEAASLELSIANDVVLQLNALQRARLAVEEYRQRLVPLQERIVALTQQQQSYMLIGTFELLSAKRELLQTYQNYLNATGEYWIKHVELSATVGGKLPDAAGDASYGISVGVDALPDTQSSSAEHANMHMGETP